MQNIEKNKEVVMETKSFRRNSALRLSHQGLNKSVDFGRTASSFAA
jgi:hypothetical protein